MLPSPLEVFQAINIDRSQSVAINGQACFVQRFRTWRLLISTAGTPFIQRNDGGWESLF